MVRFDVLGSVRASTESGRVELGGPRRRDLLTLLLAHRGGPVLLERLADGLWEGRPPGTATRTLRAHVSHLRRALGDPEIIVTVPGGYRIGGDADVDADRFEADLAHARALRAAGDRHGAWSAYEAAREHWRGEPYEDVDLDLQELEADRRRLNALRLHAEKERAAVGLELGYHRQLIADLQELVARHPHDETLVQRLACAVYADGRQTEALSIIRHLRAVLRDELGLEPTPATRQVEVAILRQELPVAAGRVVDVRAGQVPVPVGPTVGRTAEVLRISGLLAEERLVTLVGPGGVGKTRLALEAARSTVDSFTDGAAFVSYTSVRDPHAVVEHLASALGIAQQVGRSTRRGILEFLQPRQMLLVVDNCEHLLDAVAELIEWAVAAASDLRILATSRQRLALPGEVVVPVGPLAVVEEGGAPGAAVELFVQTARRRVPDLQVDGQDLEMVADVCRRVDALPLAIELAASRCAIASLTEIVNALEDPLQALSRGLRTSDPRHRSLEATIGWSYDLLDIERQMLLRAVSSFSGPFDRSDADAVCGGLDGDSIQDGLEDLVECSLLTAAPSTGATRYVLLDTIRSFAIDELHREGEATSVLSAHLDHHVKLARECQLGLLVDQRWFQRLEDVLPDLRSAFNHAIHTEDPAAALRLAGSLALFMSCRHFNEGASWVDAAMALAERSDAAVDPRISTSALAALGFYRCMRGDLQDGRHVLQRAIELYRGTDAEDRLCSSGLLWSLHGASFHPPADDPSVGCELATNALEIAHETGDPVAIFYLSVRLAESLLVAATHERGEVTASQRARIEDVVSHALEFAAEHFGPGFDGFGRSVAEIVLGIVQALDGPVDDGLVLAEGAALRLHQQRLGPHAAGRLVSLGQFSIRTGRRRRAEELIRLGLGWIADTGFTYPLRPALVSTAALLIEHDPTTATRLLGAADRFPVDVHSNYAFVSEHEVHRRARELLGSAAFERAYNDGTRLAQHRAVSLALQQVTTTDQRANEHREDVARAR